MREDTDTKDQPDYPGHVGSGGGGDDDDSRGTPEQRSWKEREPVTVH